MSNERARGTLQESLTSIYFCIIELGYVVVKINRNFRFAEFKVNTLGCIGPAYALVY